MSNDPRTLIQVARTPGSQAGRVALNQYGGAHYVEWDAMDDTWGQDDDPTGGRAAVPTLTLAPNPSTGTVRVSYSVPTLGKGAALRLYDGWGQAAGYYPLAGASAETTLALRLRPGLYTCVLEVDGVRRTQQRLVITTP